MAPVVGFEVEAIFLLTVPGKLVFVDHCSSASASQSAPSSKPALFVACCFPLKIADLLAFGLERLSYAHRNFIIKQR
jgi:hypothetical protein